MLFTSSDSKISGFTRPHVIGFDANLFFSTLESGFTFFGFAVEFAGCVWTVAISGKKKLWIRKYPDTCGRGLSWNSLIGFTIKIKRSKELRLSKHLEIAPVMCKPN